MTRRAVAVLCRPDLAPGFALAGARATEATDPASAAVRLRELCERDDVGIVLVQDDLVGEGRAADAGALPLILTFPGPRPQEAYESAADYVAELLRRAIGYRVRLE